MLKVDIKDPSWMVSIIDHISRYVPEARDGFAVNYSYSDFGNEINGCVVYYSPEIEPFQIETHGNQEIEDAGFIFQAEKLLEYIQDSCDNQIEKIPDLYLKITRDKNGIFKAEWCLS